MFIAFSVKRRMLNISFASFSFAKDGSRHDYSKGALQESLYCLGQHMHQKCSSYDCFTLSFATMYLYITEIEIMTPDVYKD